MPDNIERLIAIMATLRDPAGGCPWDLEQTFRTIAPHTLEEAYEVVDAVERGDMADLKEELGDLLFQVVYYAQMANEAGEFDFSEVAGVVADKMIRRHPHVFAGDSVRDSAEMTDRWETGKAAERERKGAGSQPSALDGVIPNLPSLTRAVKLQKRAARVGFDWVDAADILDKINEEVDELRAELAQNDLSRIQDELGDLLFALANLARRLDIDPEAALRQTNAKFERRFRRIEDLLAAEGRTPADATLEEMESRWLRAKLEEAGRKP